MCQLLRCLSRAVIVLAFTSCLPGLVAIVYSVLLDVVVRLCSRYFRGRVSLLLHFGQL